MPLELCQFSPEDRDALQLVEYEPMNMTEPTAPPIIPIEKLIKIYVRMRDAKSAWNKERDAEEKEKFGTPMEMIERELLARAQAQGVDGFKTEFGTMYVSETVRASGADWGAFVGWLKDIDADPLDYLEKRIKVDGIKRFMEANDGALPPGVNIFKKVDANIRRSTDAV
jgi:hypothetical protein